MEHEHTIAGLIRKRAEIAGLLDAAQTAVRQYMIDLDAVDTTLRLFDPAIDLADIKPKPLPPRHMAFKGEVSRSLLSAMRTASGPLTTHDLAERVMAERGLSPLDRKLVAMVRKRVAASLRHMRVRGTIQSDRPNGHNVRWFLSQRP